MQVKKILFFSSPLTRYEQWLRAFCCLLLTISLISVTVCSNAESFSNKLKFAPLNLSPDIQDSINPEITSNGNTVYTVWVGLGGSLIKQSDIYFSKSLDGGLTFNTTLNLSNNLGSSFNPQMAVSGKNVYVVWQDGTGQSGNTTILFRKSSDGGATFGPSVTIHKYSGISRRPAIFASGSSVFLVWQDLRSEGSQQIYYSRSIDSGRTFSFPISLSKGTDIDSINAKIYAENNSKIVHIVWTEGNFNEGRSKIIYEKSSDGGGTFGSPIVISGSGKFATNPVITPQGNSVYILWKEGALDQGQTKFRASADAGVTFGNTLNLSLSSNSSAGNIFAIGSDIYASWTFASGDKKQIAFRASNDSGATFAKIIVLSSPLRNGSSPQIIANKDKIYVVWNSANGGSSDIAGRKSHDMGNTFEHPEFISTHHESSNPKVSMSGNKTYVIWQSGNIGAHHILFTTAR